MTDIYPGNYISKKTSVNNKSKHNTSEVSAIDSLRLMKYSAEWDGGIKEFGPDPFNVIFWTKQQSVFYNQLASREKMSISLDATGRVISETSLLANIHKFLEKEPRLPHIFLYVINVKRPNGVCVPVGQMLSAQQDSTKISYFFDRW